MNTNTSPTENVHVGELLKKYIDTHRIYKSALNRKLNKPQNTVLRYQKQESLQSSVLFDLSNAMKHNFFADLAAFLPESYSTDAPKDNSQAERIAELEEQIRILQAEKLVLLEALKKG